MMRSIRKLGEMRPWKDASAPMNGRTRLSFPSDARGAIAVMFALGASILIGAVGIAVDVGLWEATHRELQNAADSAAISAIVGFQAGVDVATQADAVAASYHFVNGVAGATVTTAWVPAPGSQSGVNNAIQVTISQPQARFFSLIFGRQPVAESAHAIAIQTSNACILALAQTVSTTASGTITETLGGNISGAVSAQGSVAANANGCSIYSDSTNTTSSISAGGGGTISASQIGAVGGFYGQTNMTAVNGFTHGAVISDPYAYFTPPAFSGCDQNNFMSHTTQTIYPGVYCGGMKLNASANVTMSPGVYYLDQGSLSVNGSATLTGSGVTIIFTSSTGSNYATASIAGGATVNLSAPTSGPTRGFLMYGDRNMPLGTSFGLAGGSGQVFNGISYFPQGAVSYAGGASTFNGCTQIVADTVSFVGNSTMALNCTAFGVKKIGAIAQLVE